MDAAVIDGPQTGLSGMIEIDRQRPSFRVRRDAYRDPAIFKREMAEIFSRCWLYLGHDSEIQAPGSFQRRRVAERDIIFVRSRRDGVKAFYNACPHRGVTICREREGKRNTFTCPYHGWVFNTEGKLSHTGMAGGYNENFNDDGRYNLLPVERLEQYRGFWFVNFNPRAVDLATYLADAKVFIDLICEQTETGHEVIGRPHEYVINANYKYLAENSYDGYHGVETHQSYFDFLADRLKASGQEEVLNGIMADYPKGGIGGGLGNGHGFFESWIPNGKPVASWIPPWGPVVKEEIDRLRAGIFSRHDEARAKRICDHQKNLVIFPNLVINDHVSITIRSFQPEAVDRMRVTAWAVGPKDEIPLLRKIRLDNFLTFLGPAGFATPDDNEMLELAQSALEHTPSVWSDISRGMTSDDDLMTSQSHWTDENQVRSYWAQWDRILGGAETLEAK